MNRIFLRHIMNTGSAYGLAYKYERSSAIVDGSSYQEILQTPSITTSGRRWQQELENMSSSNTLATTLSQDTLAEKDVDTLGQSQKRAAAIKLLISWREDDEQEQKETLEYLQRALEEDRLSDRKLFP